MLVAISGSQGSGKSTIIHEIEKLGYKTIDRKTSRSILSDWGVTLTEVNSNPELTTSFQDEITKRKFQDEEWAFHTSDLIFTERTHADLFTYALVTLGKENEYSDWLDNYYHTCMKYNQLYTGVFFLKAGQFNVVYDGTRGTNMHYSRMVDITMLDITQQLVHNSKLTVIDTPDLNQRVNMITLQSEGPFRLI